LKNVTVPPEEPIPDTVRAPGRGQPAVEAVPHSISPEELKKVTVPPEEPIPDTVRAPGRGQPAVEAVPHSISPEGGKQPYASSLGELEEEAVIPRAAKQLPPKAKSVDWYEGGSETVTTVTEKYRGRPITVVETHVTGGTWTQLHTVLSREHATAKNVSRAVTAKLNKFFDLMHNPARRSARDPRPIAPNTFRRVVLDGKPEAIVVHIQLRDTQLTPELRSAAEKALSDYPSLGDLPPTRVVITASGPLGGEGSPRVRVSPAASGPLGGEGSPRVRVSPAASGPLGGEVLLEDALLVEEDAMTLERSVGHTPPTRRRP
jgi:hypothetical protein